MDGTERDVTVLTKKNRFMQYYFTFFKDFMSRGIPMDLEMFLNILKSPETKKKVAEVRAETDASKRQRLKKSLPQALLQAYSTNGIRTKATTLSNGYVLIDIDHIENPVEQFAERVLPKKDEIGLRIAYVTASGEGLRIVCNLIPGLTTIAENQQAICNVLGFKFDESCIDFSRTSYLTTIDDLLYLDEAVFSEEPPFVLENPDYQGNETAETASDVNDDEADYVETSAEKTIGEKKDGPSYKGVPFSVIIADYWVGRGGIPMHGERHTEVLKFLHRLKHICHFNAQEMMDAVGNAFGLEKAELERMIKDVLNYPCSGKMPYDLYQILNNHGVADDITEVDANEEKAYPVKDDDIPVNDLHPVVKAFVKMAPEGFKTPMIYIVCTTLGFLFTRLRALYLDNLLHSPTLMMTLEAPMTSGKAFAKMVVDILTKRVKMADDEARLEEKQYKLALSQSKNKKDQPEPPTSHIRKVPGRNSVSKILQRLSAACGLHLFSYDSEISTVLGNQKAAWADKSSLYRNSFDNDNFGQDYMSENSASEDVPVYLNFVYCGTPREVDKLYTRIEDGTNSRLIPCSIPDQFGQKFPVWGKLSKKDMSIIDEALEDAEHMTYDENRNIKSEVVVNMSWLFPVVNEWFEKQRLYSIKNANKAVDTLRKRSAVIAFRMALIMYHLYGCKKSKRKCVENFFLWAATATLHQQLNRFGDELNEILDEKKQRKTAGAPLTKSQSLYDLLPSQFTTADVDKNKDKAGIKREARKVISDFVLTGIATKVGPGMWRKCN